MAALLKRCTLAFFVPPVLLYSILFAMPAMAGFLFGSEPKRYTVSIVQAYPRDRNNFTQGFLFHSGLIYESTGLYGQSKIAIYPLGETKPLKQLALSKRHFGEGLAILGDKIYQLTYKARKGFVYDKKTLKKLKTFRYQTEGWGLTAGSRYLIMSDGSAALSFLDPDTLKIKDKITVKKDGRHVYGLNELEYIDGLIYANIWQTDTILIIKPRNGKVVGEVDLSQISKQYKGDKRVGVLNGIAWDDEKERLLITGKRWPHIYHIELTELKSGN